MTTNPKADPFYAVNIAAVQNIMPGFVDMLNKLGLETAIVVFNTTIESEVHCHPEVEKGLGLELEAAGFGLYDATFYLHESRWCFFHLSDLGKGLGLLKSQLKGRGLLCVSTILHAEEWNAVRVYYSPDQREIACLVEEP